MKFRVAAVAKNVKLPEGYEITDGHEGKVGDVVFFSLKEVENTHTKLIRGPDDEAYEPKEGECYLSCLTRRYAPMTVIAEPPGRPRKGDILDVISRGGALSVMVDSKPGLKPTKAEFLGFVTHKGKKLNIMDFSLPVLDVKKVPRVIYSVGVIEGCGKTTTNKAITEGLTKKGYKVCVGKVTGQGNPHDVMLSKYAGAVKVHGVVDAGTPSTVGNSTEELENVFMRVFSSLAAEDPDFLLIEMGNGLTQREVSMMLKSKPCKRFRGQYVLSCQDPPGAYGGVRLLREKHGITPFLISGKGTATGGSRKEIEDFTGIRAYSPLAQQKELTEAVLKAFGM